MHFCDLRGLCTFFGNFRAQNVILDEKRGQTHNFVKVGG